MDGRENPLSMFDIPYLFFLNPKRTIQMYNHVPNWWSWWVFLVISAVLMAIQVNTATLISIVFQLMIAIIGVGLMSVFVDTMAQIMGSEGHVKQLVYWLGFVQAIFWLSPLTVVIQMKFPIIGSGLFVCIFIAYCRQLFITVATVYNLSRLKTMALFLVPIMVGLAMVFIIIIAGIQVLLGMA